MYFSKREIVGTLAGLGLGIILGFFVGQEYFKYKLVQIIAPIGAQVAGLLDSPTKATKGLAKKQIAQTDIKNLETALELFYLDMGRYPTAEEGLMVLIQAPDNLPNWGGPYLKKFPKDPWERDYVYKCPGEHGRPYSLSSLGELEAKGH